MSTLFSPMALLSTTFGCWASRSVKTYLAKLGVISTTREYFHYQFPLRPRHDDGLCLTCSLQTPVYALYAVPTIVSAAIMLATRQLGVALPTSPEGSWWELFDAEWEDVWSVAGYIMRLYRERTHEDHARVLNMVTKKGVRSWLEDQKPIAPAVPFR